MCRIENYFSLVDQTWERNWCGNRFFQSLHISNAKLLLSGYFWGNNSWEVMNGKRQTWRYLGSVLALIPLPPPALGNAGPESKLLEKVSSYSQPMASGCQGHSLRGFHDCCCFMHILLIPSFLGTLSPYTYVNPSKKGDISGWKTVRGPFKMNGFLLLPTPRASPFPILL